MNVRLNVEKTEEQIALNKHMHCCHNTKIIYISCGIEWNRKRLA